MVREIKDRQIHEYKGYNIFRYNDRYFVFSSMTGRELHIPGYETFAQAVRRVDEVYKDDI